MDHVSEYIGRFPPEVQERLNQIREVIQEEAPRSEEGFSYGMPAYKLEGKPLVYFAAFTNHIGFYATPTGHEAFCEELKGYKQGKGSVQFPLEKPLPLDLIRRIVEFRVRENSQSTKKRK